MRSTFRVLFYTKNQTIKNGRVPVMGRITVNGTTASFGRKRDVPFVLWDAKGNCIKTNPRGKTAEPGAGEHQGTDRQAPSISLSDHDSGLTAKKVCAMTAITALARRSIRWWRSSISRSGITNGRSARRKPKAPTEGLVDESTSVCPVIWRQVGWRISPDVAGHGFHQNYYNWMLSVHGLAKSTTFERVNTLKWLMYLAMDEDGSHKHPFKKFVCKPEYKNVLSSRRRTCNALSASEAGLQSGSRPSRRHVCFHVLQQPAHVPNLKELSYGMSTQIRTATPGWLETMLKTKATYVVKLLPIAVRADREIQGGERIQRFLGQGVPVKWGVWRTVLKRIGEGGCSVRVSPHVAKHNAFAI